MFEQMVWFDRFLITSENRLSILHLCDLSSPKHRHCRPGPDDSVSHTDVHGPRGGALWGNVVRWVSSNLLNPDFLKDLKSNNIKEGLCALIVF